MINEMGGIGNISVSHHHSLPLPSGTNGQTLHKGAAVLNDYNGLTLSLLRGNHYQLSMVTLNVAAASAGVWLKIYSSDLHTHHGNPVSDHPASCGRTPCPVAPAVTTEPCRLAHTGQRWYGRLTCREHHRRKELLLSTVSWQDSFDLLSVCVYVDWSSIRFTCNTRHTADSFYPVGVFSTWKPNPTASNVWIVAVCTGAQQGAHFTAPTKLF